jgi:hypothetical protein
MVRQVLRVFFCLWGISSRHCCPRPVSALLGRARPWTASLSLLGTGRDKCTATPICWGRIFRHVVIKNLDCRRNHYFIWNNSDQTMSLSKARDQHYWIKSEQDKRAANSVVDNILLNQTDVFRVEHCIWKRTASFIQEERHHSYRTHDHKDLG